MSAARKTEAWRKTETPENKRQTEQEEERKMQRMRGSREIERPRAFESRNPRSRGAKKGEEGSVLKERMEWGNE